MSVNKWRLWLGSGMGEVISHELAATMASLKAPKGDARDGWCGAVNPPRT